MAANNGVCPDPSFGFGELTASPIPNLGKGWFGSVLVDRKSETGKKILRMICESVPCARLVEIRRFGNRFDKRHLIFIS